MRGKHNFGGTTTTTTTSIPIYIQSQVLASLPPAQPVAEQESISEMIYPKALSMLFNSSSLEDTLNRVL